MNRIGRASTLKVFTFPKRASGETHPTAARLIGLWKFTAGYWGKLDAKLPYDWNEEEASAEVEVQLGRMFTPQFGLYLEGLAGIGNDRGYNWGAGLGIRFIY